MWGPHIVSMRGQVKWFDAKKGYGFIVTPDRDGDIFVHYTEIAGDGFRKLLDGESVEFELTETAKGLQARQVRRLAGDDASVDGAGAMSGKNEFDRPPPDSAQGSARDGD